MLALQTTEGYIEFSLEPPRLDEGDIPHFEIINIVFDPTQISSERLGEVIAQASGLTVTEIEPIEERR